MNGNDRKSGIGHIDFLLFDFAALIISFILSYVIKFRDFGFISDSSWLSLLFITSLLNLVICIFAYPYEGILRRPYYEEILRSLMMAFYNLIAASIIFYVFKIGIVFSRQMILTMYFLYFILSLGAKCLWKKLILAGKIKSYSARRISLFVVTDKASAAEALQNIRAGDFETYEIKGICLADGDDGSIEGIPAYNDINTFPDYVAENGIEEVFVDVDPSLIPPETYKKLISSGVGIHLSLDSLINFRTEDYDVENVGIYKTLTVGRYTFSAGQQVYLAVKRLLDIIIGIIGLIILLPVTAIVKLINLAEGDRAKIFYTQTRIGKNGRKFRMYKFRTMVPDADKVLAELLKDETVNAQWQKNQKLENDPRITKAGRLLRKTSVDELPQFINVLKGDMSLVGPRPLIEGELESHDGMKLYQQVKPGITGWWGCNGRSNIGYRERLELEYYYIKNLSAYLDFLCVLRTVLSVVKRDGAQ